MNTRPTLYKKACRWLSDLLLSPTLIANLRKKVECQRISINQYITEIDRLKKVQEKWQKEKLYLKDKIKKLKNNNLVIHRQLKSGLSNENDLRTPYK